MLFLPGSAGPGAPAGISLRAEDFNLRDRLRQVCIAPSIAAPFDILQTGFRGQGNDWNRERRHRRESG